MLNDAGFVDANVHGRTGLQNVRVDGGQAHLGTQTARVTAVSRRSISIHAPRPLPVSLPEALSLEPLPHGSALQVVPEATVP